jgi:predicted PurR-regulated permease PerM
MPRDNASILRDLRTAAYVVVVAAGIRASSEIVSIVLISLLLAYALLPFPSWCMHRFGLRRTSAIVLTVALTAAVYLVLGLALADTGVRMYEKMPIYEQHFRSMYGQLAAYLSAHGYDSARISFENLSSPEEIVKFARLLFPTAIGLLSDRMLVSLLITAKTFRGLSASRRRQEPSTRWPI